LQNYAIVFFGAGIGGMCRYWCSSIVYKFLPTNFPYGTLVVNIIGSFILGFVFYSLYEKGIINQDMRLFLSIGFCGGFTTFSTFSFETINLLKNSEYFFAVLNISANVIFSLTGTFTAYILSK